MGVLIVLCTFSTLISSNKPKQPDNPLSFLLPGWIRTKTTLSSNLLKLESELNYLGRLDPDDMRLSRQLNTNPTHFKSRIAIVNWEFKDFRNKLQSLSEYEITDKSKLLLKNTQRIIDEMTFEIRFSRITELYLENANDPEWQNEFERTLAEMNHIDYSSIDNDVLNARLDELLIVQFDMNQLIKDTRQNLKISDLAGRVKRLINLVPKRHSDHFSSDFFNWVESKRNQFVDQRTLKEAEEQLQEIEKESLLVKSMINKR